MTGALSSKARPQSYPTAQFRASRLPSLAAAAEGGRSEARHCVVNL